MKCRLLFVIVFVLSASLPLYSQQETLGSIYTSLDELERTLLDIQSENESLKSDTASLRENLRESLDANGRLLKLSAELRRLSDGREREFKRLSASLDTSERSLKNWRLASLIEAGALIAGLIVFIAAR